MPNFRVLSAILSVFNGDIHNKGFSKDINSKILISYNYALVLNLNIQLFSQPSARPVFSLLRTVMILAQINLLYAVLDEPHCFISLGWS